MPKVVINFKLPEERAEYLAAVHATEWKSIVYEISMLVRDGMKYGHQYKTANEALQAVKDKLWYECYENHLDPWEDM